MEIVIIFEGRAVLFKKSVENGHFALSPHEIFKKLTGMIKIFYNVKNVHV